MTWWHYLLLVNIYLVLFYGFYVLLLRKETFFQLNRVYMIAAALLSFFIPVIQSGWVKNLFITQRVQYTIYSSPVMIYHFKPVQYSYITVGQIVLVIYAAGICFLAAKFIRQLFLLKKIMANAASKTTFSFFKKIKFGDDYISHDAIAAHEQVHASQWHSADVLIMEIVTIINWFNPVVYFYRVAIKHIHEFIADRQALKLAANKADYALLLLNHTFSAPVHQLVNPFFNNSLLKRRILMLNKTSSRSVALIKYCFSVPLFILMLILSSATVNNSRTIHIINKKAENVFLTPAMFKAYLIANDDDNEEKISPSAKMVNELFKKAPGTKRPVIIAEKDTVPKKDRPIFTSVEQVPEFPGGIQAFFKFLSENIRYPSESRRLGVQGRVIISFIVEQDGSLTNIKVVRGVAGDIDKEALRVINLSPKWKPGIQNGHTVRVEYSVPISFTLNDVRPKNSKQDNEVKKDTNIILDTTKKPGEFHLQEMSKPPLYLIDGVEATSFDSLNPANIKSIKVLKEKSAIALYGPKGANGVVIITTKSAGLIIKPPLVKPVQ